MRATGSYHARHTTCTSAPRATLSVAAALMRVGVKDIRVLVGGWDGWKANGGAVETSPLQ